MTVKDPFSVQRLMHTAVSEASTMDEIALAAKSVLRLASHMTPSGRVGYLSGIISSMGHERIQEMTVRLEELTARMRQNVALFSFPVFSSSDIFPSSGNVEAKVKASGGALTQPAFHKFWDEVLRSRFVTDVFMTPAWHLSPGATMENRIAEELKMAIHFYNRSPGLMIIWNRSPETINGLYTPSVKRPYYAEHETDRISDMFLLRRAVSEAAAELEERIDNNVRNGQKKAITMQDRSGRSQALVEAYYAAF